MADLINHLELAESRLGTEFRESTNLIAYIKALLSEADTLEDVFQCLLTDRNLNTSTGVPLEIIGALVGEFNTQNLTDDQFRLRIRARIARNNTEATPEQIIAQLSLLFNEPLVFMLDGDTYYEISFGRTLTADEKLVLQSDLVPKTAGVNGIYLAEFDKDDFFGFSAVPGAKGFGDLNDPLIGGTMASLIFP